MWFIFFFDIFFNLLKYCSWFIILFFVYKFFFFGKYLIVILLFLNVFLFYVIEFLLGVNNLRSILIVVVFFVLFCLSNFSILFFGNEICKLLIVFDFLNCFVKFWICKFKYKVFFLVLFVFFFKDYVYLR